MDVTTDSMHIKRIVQEYYEQFYVHTFNRLGKMEQWKRHNLHKFMLETLSVSIKHFY
jgi:hypothetical protein